MVPLVGLGLYEHARISALLEASAIEDIRSRLDQAAVHMEDLLSQAVSQAADGLVTTAEGGDQQKLMRMRNYSTERSVLVLGGKAMAKGDQAREQVLAEAAGLFVRKGFRATSVSDLVKVTGAKRGSLYHHFPGKRELGLAVLERARGGFIEFIESVLQGPTPWDRLEGFFDAALAKHRENKFVGGCLWGNTALEMADEDAEYAGLVAEVFDEWIGLIEAVAADGQRAGQVRSDLPAHALARHIVAAVEGGIMMSRLKKDAGPLSDCLSGLRQMLRSNRD